MNKTPDKVEAERKNIDRLYMSLGRFIFEFSQLDFMIRHALGEALALSDEQFDVITSSYDFASLCRVTMAFYLKFMNCNKTDQKEIESLLKACLTVNDRRIQIVHGTWFIDENGSGNRHVPRSSLERKVDYQQTKELDKVTGEIEKLKSRIARFLGHPSAASTAKIG